MNIGRIVTVAMFGIALMAIASAIYVGSYLLLGKTYHATQGEYVGQQVVSKVVLRREYPYDWQVMVFTPLAL